MRGITKTETAVPPTSTYERKNIQKVMNMGKTKYVKI